MEEIAIEILTQLISKLLKDAGIPVPEAAIRRVVTVLVRNGLEYADVAADAVKQLGHGELSKLARAEARGVTVQVRCPVLNEDVDVALRRDVYVCPHCHSDIKVRKGKARHADVIVYDCPETGGEEFLHPKADTWFKCPGCKLAVYVHDEDDELRVLHTVRVRTE